MEEENSPGRTPGNDPEPLTPEIETTPRVLPERSPIAGFWRRIFAHILDVLILMAFGSLLGAVFGGFFSTLGEWGRLVGFPVATFYYTVASTRSGGEVRLLGSDCCGSGWWARMARVSLWGAPWAGEPF